MPTPIQTDAVIGTQADATIARSASQTRTTGDGRGAESLLITSYDDAKAEVLRLAIHRHLRQHPYLTCYEIARALHLRYPQGGGSLRVRRLLNLMAADGEAACTEIPRAAGDTRPAVRWWAT